MTTAELEKPVEPKLANGVIIRIHTPEELPLWVRVANYKSNRDFLWARLPQPEQDRLNKENPL